MPTLENIRKKVRLITRSPSISQLTNAEIDGYVNDFLLYDFPEHLRLFTFRKTLSFYTTPYVDTYDTNTIRANDPLYNFKNAYITSHDPIYVSGMKAYLTQSRNEFFSLFPTVQNRTQIGTGDGATTFFAGTLTGIPVLQNEVMFTSITATDQAIVITDLPRTDAVTGLRTVVGDLVWPDNPAVDTVGTINYATGEYTFTFPLVPDTGAEIYAQTHRATLAPPTTILYFDNKFIMRPVPDITYKITLETYIRPIVLVNASDMPELEQHWKYISYGAAKAIFEDRMDLESVQLILPEFKEQELLCLRRTIVQNSNQRVATIYSQQVGPGYGDWRWNNF